MSQKAHVKESFESAANEYENIIPKIIPFYHEQHAVVLSFLTTYKNKDIRVLDLGVGTGRLSQLILEKFPKAKVHGVDIAANMIEASTHNLKAYEDRFTASHLDFAHLTNTDQPYDVVLGGLSVHHLNDDEKKELFTTVKKSLAPKGCFILCELVKSQDEATNLLYLNKWLEFMEDHGIESDKVLRNHREHDQPASVEDQMQWMHDAGFKAVYCPWHYLNFAILLAR